MKTRNLLLLASLLFPLLASAYTSLTVNDPRDGGYSGQGTIETASVTIEPDGNYVFYDLQLALSAGDTDGKLNEGDSLEIVCNFDLPAGAFIKSAALLIEGEWTEAALMPRREAHAIYEGVVQRRRDPLIIYKNYGDNYQFKIFPVEVGGSREMKLRYAMAASSLDGKKTAALPWEMINASAVPVDFEITLKNTDDFSAPEIAMPMGGFTENTDGSLTATVPADLTGMAPQLVSGSDIGDVFFDYSRGESEIAYEFSFVPDAAFDLSQGKKYLIIVDNDPNVQKDTSYRYIYNDDASDYVRTVRQVYDIVPLPTDTLYSQIRLMLQELSDLDSFNIIVKNGGVYTYSDDFVPATSENLNSAISLAQSNSTSYTEDFESLMLRAKPFINEDHAVTVLLSNNQKFRNDQYTEARSFADTLVKQLELNKVIQAFDITSVRRGDYYRYMNSQMLSYFISSLSSQFSTYAYAQRMYNLDYFKSYFESLIIQNSSKIVMLNVESSSDSGYIYDKSISMDQNMLPWKKYTELGKISAGAEFTATVAFRFKGMQYNGSYSFPIGNDTNVMVEDAVALKLIDELNGVNDDDARAEAERLSGEHHVLTRNTAFLSIDPDAEVTPCEDCPDWGDWAWWGPVFPVDIWLSPDVMTMNTMDFAVSESIQVPGVMTADETFVSDGSPYSEGYLAGLGVAESNCISESDMLYTDAFQAGYAAAMDDVETTLEAVPATLKVTASPNPFDDKLVITVPGDAEATVVIYNAVGQPVLTEVFEGTLSLDSVNETFALLPDGVYVVEVEYADEVETITVVKK